MDAFAQFLFWFGFSTENPEPQNLGPSQSPCQLHTLRQLRNTYIETALTEVVKVQEPLPPRFEPFRIF